jgi:hypothetical protein
VRYPRHRMTIRSPRLAPVLVRTPGKKTIFPPWPSVVLAEQRDARKAALNERKPSLKEDERIVHGAGSATRSAGLKADGRNQCL